MSVELARQHWEEGHRRLQAEAGDPRRYAQLLEQVEILTEELRRRVGSTFTLAELAVAYRGAERWGRDAVAERTAGANWAPLVATATDAAFRLYARGARDYTP